MNTKKLVTVALAGVLGASVALTGCGSINKDATLVTINDGEATISLGYGNFTARYQQALYDQFLMAYYGEQMWTTDMSGAGVTFQEEVKADILESLEEQYLCRTHASEYNVSISDEDAEAIKTAVADFMAANSADTIDALGATEAYLVQYLEDRTYVTRVSDAIMDAADVTVTDDECWQRSFSYVFTESEDDAKTLSATNDFAATAEELGQEVRTYTYTKGNLEDSIGADVISAAEALTREGQVSSAIEVDGGYYVLCLDADKDADATESKRASLTSSKKSEAYQAILDGWKENTVWTVDDNAWEKVQFDTLFKAVEEEVEE